ncbi:hypothetical protein F2Q68_00016847 [Brassica cretica]|uniref:Uncharacterized protein n=1 Tax=Brassica cretica TaxID=69181 RepID=A0A8S9HCQ7_BRACR|nr:hypothetical protein F2Q68_00016847 [Brassica cretica]
MMTMAKHMLANTTQFRNKEAETTSLKNQLRGLQKCLESMIHNQQQANTYFDPLGNTSPGFLSSDEVFTSRYGSTSIIYHPKTTRSKSRHQKESEFQVNSNKKRTLTSSSSHESVEDNKKKGHDIGIIEFSMANLLNNLSKLPETYDEKNQQPSSSRQIRNIGHISDTSSSDYETESNEQSLPK